MDSSSEDSDNIARYCIQYRETTDTFCFKAHATRGYRRRSVQHSRCTFALRYRVLRSSFFTWLWWPQPPRTTHLCWYSLSLCSMYCCCCLFSTSTWSHFMFANTSYLPNFTGYSHSRSRPSYSSQNGDVGRREGGRSEQQSHHRQRRSFSTQARRSIRRTGVFFG